MPTLHLGVNDVPYVDKPSPRAKKTRAGTVTTGQVAEWLEDDYGIFTAFISLHADDIGNALANSISGAMESLLMKGSSLDHNVFGTATQEIEGLFQTMLLKKELDGKVPGVPTQAAIKGINPRKKRRTPNRPSFVASGLFMANVRAWVD